MSKASRRRQQPGPRPAPAASPTTPSGTPPPSAAASSAALGAGTTSRTSGESTRPSQGPSGTSRTGRRPASRVTRQRRPFTERYRGWIIGIAAVAGVALIGLFVFSSAAAPAYACSTLFDPAPTASPSAGQSPSLGFAQDDMGKTHVASGTKITYTFCPPASGNHYNASGLGPIQPRVYGPNDKTVPQGWIHNLEHGALVLLYRGDSAGATPEGQQALKDFFAVFPASPICQTPPGTIVGPVFTRFDSMKTPFAALVWDRVMPLESLDKDAILAFYAQWGEQLNPELTPAGCVRPTPSPEPSSSASPSGSAAPSASPSASESASPSAPASASPSASPS